MHLLLPLARRFVAGTNMDGAVEAVRKLNQPNILATLDILGENVTHATQAKQAASEYMELVKTIDQERLKSNVSLKLSQMGLSVDANLAYQNMVQILEVAKQFDNFVRIDMEGSDLTQKTLQLFWKLRDSYSNVGIVIQAYLYRSENDIKELIQRGGSVRLCKGAYKEPAAIAFQNMNDIRSNYVRLMTMLFEALAQGKPVFPAIATHDDQLIEKAMELTRALKIPPSAFEFQFLYGLRRQLALKLAAQGYKVRAYVPYGNQWFPYFYRRLRERKENVFFIVRNLFRD